MMYALNIGENNRILSVTSVKYAFYTQPKIDILPDGDITDYDYIDGKVVLNEARKAERELQTQEKSVSQVEINTSNIDYIMMMEGL